MKTIPDAEALLARPRTLSAANEEFTGTANEPTTTVRHRATGWDPYEVWRTRVKAIQDKAEPSVAIR
jgi:hypothetical protein